MSHSLFFRLDRSQHAVPVSDLRIGESAEVLEKSGLGTLGALLGKLEAEPRTLKKIIGLDQYDIKIILLRIEVIASLVDDDGFVDWSQFQRHFGVASARVSTAENLGGSDTPATEKSITHSSSSVDLYPSREVTDGKEFIASIPEVIDAILEARRSKLDELILAERILKFPEDRWTLEKIAAPVSVTRERVRQKEAKLIQLLFSSFVLERQRKLGVALRPSFTSYWKRAVTWFGTKEEINFADFMDGLQEAWGVSAELLFPNLPLILAILTSKATIPESLRNQMRLDPGFFTSLAESIRTIPLRSIPLDEPAEELVDLGLVTLGNLWDSLKSGVGPSPKSITGRRLRKAASALKESFAANGSIDWISYAKLMELEVHPESDPDSALDFMRKLPDDLEKIIQANDITARSAVIFRMRIAVLRSYRPTLEQTGNTLGTYGPSIKREESIMLATLNDQLVGGDISTAKVWLRPNFLNYWRGAAEIYTSSHGNFDHFRMLISLKWGIPLQVCGIAAEILWAVLNEYPGGRNRRRANKPSPEIATQLQPIEPGLIMLRGFRTAH